MCRTPVHRAEIGAGFSAGCRARGVVEGERAGECRSTIFAVWRRPAQFKIMTQRKAVVYAAVCLFGAAFSGVGAFAPVALMPASTAPRNANVLLRSGVALQEPSVCPASRAPQTATGGSRIALRMAKTNLVTYGDMWRDALNENEDGKSTEASSDNDEFAPYTTDELSTMASEAIKPIKQAAAVAATAIWDRLTHSPDDKEIQRNLKAFARSHSGAVMTPLEEDELASEVRYLGMFPDLIDALLEAQQDADDKASKDMEEAVEAIAQAAALGATERDILV